MYQSEHIDKTLISDKKIEDKSINFVHTPYSNEAGEKWVPI